MIHSNAMNTEYTTSGGSTLMLKRVLLDTSGAPVFVTCERLARGSALLPLNVRLGSLPNAVIIVDDDWCVIEVTELYAEL